MAAADVELAANGSGGGDHGEDQVGGGGADREKPSKKGRKDRDLEEDEERAASRKRRHHHRENRDRDRERHHRDGRDRRHHRHRDASSGEDEEQRDKELDGEGSRRHHSRSRHRSSSSRHHSKSSGRHHRHHRNHSRSPPSDDHEDVARRSRSPSTKAKSRSPSKPPEERSRSRSRSESKRASGFDVLPSGPAVVQPGMVMPFGVQGTMTQQATRHARRVYVGGLPPLVNEQRIAAFFNQVMENVGGNTFGPGDSVVNVYINHEKRFAFVEMRSVEEASNAMALDGIFFNGISVRVKRPSDYDLEVAGRLGPIHPSPCLNLGAVGLQYRSSYAAAAATADILTDKIYVGNIPSDWTEEDVRVLMEPFGALKSVDIIKDASGISKGAAFVVYQDSKNTDVACTRLNNTTVMERTLAVRRANTMTGPRPEVPSFMGPQQVALEGDIPTKVVCLTNAVSEDELKDDAVFVEIVEDMMEECGKYGDLKKVEIPRPPPSSGVNIPGLGKVFLEYKDVTGSIKAKCSLDGRKFAGKPVEARYYPEHRFADGDYSF